MTTLDAYIEARCIGGSYGRGQMVRVKAYERYFRRPKATELPVMMVWNCPPPPTLQVEYEHFILRYWRFEDGKIVPVVVLEGMAEDEVRSVMDDLKRRGAFE